MSVLKPARLLAERALAPLTRSKPQSREEQYRVTGTCSSVSCHYRGGRARTGTRIFCVNTRQACSKECLRDTLKQVIFDAVQASDRLAPPYHHRMPLGLLALSRGWISKAQLQRALKTQQATGRKIGRCLVESEGIDEVVIARAIAAQWALPLLSERTALTEKLLDTLPRIFMDAFGILPVRLVGDRTLYVAFEEAPDASMIRTIEEMTMYSIEPVVMPDSLFWRTFDEARAIAASDPKLYCYTALEDLVSMATKLVADSSTGVCRICNMREYLWLRTAHDAEITTESQNWKDYIFYK